MRHEGVGGGGGGKGGKQGWSVMLEDWAISCVKAGIEFILLAGKAPSLARAT